MTLLYGANDDVRNWVSTLLYGNDKCFREGDGAIGVLDQGKLIAGIVYSNYCVDNHGKAVSIEMSIASVDKRWANRHNLRAFFAYPFIDLKVKRVQTLCSANEGDIVNFNKRIGFRAEGYHKEAWPLGGDAVSFGMLKDECKWL